MYNVLADTSERSFSNNSPSNIPVGRVNDLKPLGHSGQRKLQDVVGSIDKLMGIPQ